MLMCACGKGVLNKTHTTVNGATMYCWCDNLRCTMFTTVEEVDPILLTYLLAF